ncbi:hypothetical protein [Burkholderia diffusa]|uniref:hypothetical protein n=1 Tax=Burkholderia diffusa TaxID=488732 RepID=UPI002AB2D081|nr:hypothetical protein [Burkholderia diffusa]
MNGYLQLGKSRAGFWLQTTQVAGFGSLFWRKGIWIWGSARIVKMEFFLLRRGVIGDIGSDTGEEGIAR